MKFDRKTIIQFRNFALVGGISTIVNYGIFFCLAHFGHVYYILASSIGFCVGIFVSYSLNCVFTFQPEDSSVAGKSKEFLMYAVVCLFSLVLSLGSLWVFVEVFKIHPLIGNVLAIGVSTISNFVGIKLFVFKQ